MDSSGWATDVSASSADASYSPAVGGGGGAPPVPEKDGHHARVHETAAHGHAPHGSLGSVRKRLSTSILRLGKKSSREKGGLGGVDEE
jgi:hypothetical protein